MTHDGPIRPCVNVSRVNRLGATTHKGPIEPQAVAPGAREVRHSDAQRVNMAMCGGAKGWRG